jgi:hypothetical protein
VRLLLFIPSYNDAASAHALAKRFLGEGGVERAMIVDDSDEPSSAAYAESIRNSGVEAVRRRRAGKWSAWRLALLGLCSLLPLEDRARWTMLETTKEAARRRPHGKII